MTDLAKRTWPKSGSLVANVSVTEKWGLGGGVSEAGQFLRHTSYSGAYPLPVPLLLYQVPITVGAIYHTGGWFGSPLLSIADLTSQQYGRRAQVLGPLCLAYTLAHFKES